MNSFWMVIAALLLLSAAAITFLLVLSRLVGKNKRAPSPVPTTAPTGPTVIPEIYIDRDKFTLIGPDWLHIADQPASYGCPRCGMRENIVLRSYQYAYGNQVYLLARHLCNPATPDQNTVPISVIGRASS